MFGALVGDCIGSFWEFSQNKDPSVPLWMPVSRFTDDSVCTAAIGQWLLNGVETPLAPVLVEYGLLHLGRGFGMKMIDWILAGGPEAYGSWGNGSAMRVSPVALLASSDAEAEAWAEASAAVTHNSQAGIHGAQHTAWAIRHAFRHRDPERLLHDAEARVGLSGVSKRDPAAERPEHRFDVTCAGTVPLALVLAARGGSFEGTMRWCISMGGDADTLAAIAGPIAEGLYGLPEDLKARAKSCYHPEDRIWEVIEAVYAAPRAQANLADWGRG